jgi:circadian clock protein KaiC
VPGLDTILGGGLLKGDTYLIVGNAGSGKTTLGNHLAFAHAAAGGTAIIATFLAESHDRMLAHLQGLAFADPALVARRVHYVNLLSQLEAGGVDTALDTLVQTVRTQAATLLVIDNVGETLPAGSDHEIGPFMHRLQMRSALLGCTTVLLSADTSGISGHADGVIHLTHELSAGREVRSLRVAKLRGSYSLHGWHRFVIDDEGVVIYPRLESALSNARPAPLRTTERVPFGVPSLDAMLSGGPIGGSSMLLLGTPGGGKTVLGLQFLAEGARRGEPGLIASFQETAPDLAATGDQLGMQLGLHIASEMVRVLWQAPLDLAPDAWAWGLLAAVEKHRPKRLVVDAFTDILSLFADSGRDVRFAHALVNELRRRGVTTIFNLEIDSYVGQDLAAPIPNVSAMMDAGVLVRSVELDSRLRRLISVLKIRQSGFDSAIREFVIDEEGIVVGDPLPASGLLTGDAIPDRGAE